MRSLRFADDESLTAALRAAVDVVRGDGVLLVPTETFYGLAGDPTSVSAVARMARMKGRPPAMGLPVLCADWQQLESLVKVPDAYRVGLSRSWPGALTVILPSHVDLPAGAGATLAVRIPGHGLLRSLLCRTGPLTGTSANRHEGRPCSTAQAALASLREPPDVVLDGGETTGGGASTVVDLSGSEPRVVRDGLVPWAEFRAR